MRISNILCLLLLCCFSLFSQIDPTFIDFSEKYKKGELQPIQPTVFYWKFPKNIKLRASTNTFKDWNAGGTNNISFSFESNLNADYKAGNIIFNNFLYFKYGTIWESQKDPNLRAFSKLDDKFELNSSFGYIFFDTENLFFNSNFNLKTQIDRGYLSKAKNSAYSSRFFAPAYLNLNFAGLQYDNKINENEYLYNLITPISSKYTFVFDKNLSKTGAFGVEKGKSSRGEFGAFFEHKSRYEIITDLFLRNRIYFFSSYINKFGNIDVNTETEIVMVFNTYISFNILLETIYDDDIKRERTLPDNTIIKLGASLQIKHQSSITFTYSF